MLTDPIADMLTRIRNAHLALHKEVNVPSSKMKESLAAILKQEGYVEDVAVADSTITITLKYLKGKPVISGLKRVSTPGRRVYVGAHHIPRVQNGLGICILSTSSGVLDGMAAVTVAIVFVERAQRRIPISYAKRQIGRKMYGGQNSHLPLRLNTAGVIPPIFASSLLLFPATIGQFSTNHYVKQVADIFSPHGVAYNVLYVALMFFFCYFYTAIIFDPKDMAISRRPKCRRALPVPTCSLFLNAASTTWFTALALPIRATRLVSSCGTASSRSTATR